MLLFARSNFLGTQFVLYDGGYSPFKKDNDDDPNEVTQEVRKELGVVYYVSIRKKQIHTLFVRNNHITFSKRVYMYVWCSRYTHFKPMIALV